MEAEVHAYWPSIMHMGDCMVCGNLQDHPLHAEPVAPPAPASLALAHEPERSCRVCGCTDLSACVDEDGPCCWVDEDLCSACQGRAEKATAAAHSAIEAAAELLRYCREGHTVDGRFHADIAVVEKLLDAAKMAMEVEGFDEERGQVYATIVGHLEGWAP
jgi:hypothetical protein